MIERVAGGTSDEYAELLEILPKIEYQPIVFNRIMTYKESREMYPEEISDYLRSKFGIEAVINEVGANIYRFNGKNLTHQQVLDIISGK